MKVTTSISNAVGSLSPTGSAGATRKAQNTGDTASGPNDATSTRMSGPAQLMSKLSQLKGSDPEQFSQVVSSLANELRSAAQQDSGMGGKMLTELASKLENVANGGDISQLEQPAAPAGGPRGPGAAGPAGPTPEGPPPGAAAYFLLVRDWGASKTGTYAFISPAIAVIVGCSWFDERLDWGDVAGMLLMLGAAGLALRPARS